MSKGNRPGKKDDLDGVEGNRKKVKDFECTLAHCPLSKSHVAFSLEELCEVLVVSEEAHHGDGTHFHLYLRMWEPFLIIDLRQLIGSSLYTGEEKEQWGSIHISTLRNWKHWVKYITKEDTEPYYKNIDTNLFHNSWKIYDFIRSNPIFDPLHPFMRQNPCLTNIILRGHADYWSKHENLKWKHSNRNIPVEPDVDIAWVSFALDCFWRQSHCYIYGGTGVGKTVLANYLLSQTEAGLVLPSGSTAWEFGSLLSQHTLAVAGDADSSYASVHRQVLLRLCDRAPVSVNVKCGAMRTVVFTGTIVILSNYPPPEDSAFLRRFTVIHADTYGVRKKEILQIKIEEEVSETSDDTAVWVSSSDEEVGI